MNDYRACGLISMGIDTYCDNCEREISYGEKYAYISNWGNNSAKSDKAFRYCAECAVKLGYMQWVRDKETGKVFASIFCLEGEEVVNGQDYC